MSSFTNLTFSLNNTSGTTITSFKVIRPSANFSITGYSGVGSPSTSESELTVSGVSIGSGSSLGFSVSVGSGGTEAGSASWLVSSSDGGEFTACSGSLDTAIAGSPPDTSAPIISSATVSDIYATSAKISWSTNESATSEVEYGTGSYDYTSSKSDTSLVTSHSITLTGLTANTTYYFIIRSLDAANNTAETDETLFITAAPDAGVSTTVITVQTTTQTVTKTETKTNTKIIEVRDTMPPAVSIDGDFSKPFELAPEISGRASDKSRIAAVEYSIDNGENWLPVNEILSPAQATTQFRFIPAVFDDGSYEIKVRALDGAGNYGTTRSQTVVIDRLPPLLGPFLITVGPLSLSPSGTGSIITSANVKHRIILSAAGGPTTIDLFINNRVYSLTKSVETGMWIGTFSLEEPGIYAVTYRAIDGGNNKTEGTVTALTVASPGVIREAGTNKPIKNAIITVFQKDTYTGEWYVWDGTPFNQTSPQITDSKGMYSYLLPRGEYYFRIEAAGHDSLLSTIFRIDSPTPVNTSFSLKSRLFPFQFSWDTAPVSIDIPESQTTTGSPAISVGKTTQEFVSLRGKPTIISFLNTQFPSASDQIPLLDTLYKQKSQRINMAVVTIQEKSSKIDIYAKRGGYDIPFLADPDGTIAQGFGVTTVPTHVFLDRRGVVKKISSGVLSLMELQNLLSID